jgi:hypothetical protein
MKNKFLHTFVVITLALLSGCASQQSPGGGPVDKQPPTIIESYPKDMTTHFSDDYFELTFSEWVDKSSVQSAVFVSPAVDGTLKFDWSGKSVRVYFPKPLKDSVTYVVTVGTDLYDQNNRNKMAQAFSLAFTKGDKIDKRMIEGKIYGEKTEGTLIFAYKKRGIEINPLNDKPDYVSQSGLNGKFKMTGLAEGEYRLLAVKDEFREMKYRQGDDLFGIPESDISLKGKDTLFSGLEFFMSKEDTVKPRLLNAVMTDINHVLLTFSKETDSTSYNSTNYSIYDSTINKSFALRFAYKGKTKPVEIALAMNEKLTASDDLYLIAKSFSDLNGNKTSTDAARLIYNARPDTLKPSMYEVMPPNKSSGVDIKQEEFVFSFDDALDSVSVKQGIEVRSKNNLIDYRVKFVDDASFKIKILSAMKPNEEGTIKLNLKNFADAAGNKRDSVYTYTFKTGSGMDYSAASGAVSDADTSKNNDVVVVMQSVDKDKKVYKKKTKKDLKFHFEKITPGKYILWSFIDKDGDGKYSYGRPYPFKSSEKFAFYPDTLNLRARWPVEDIQVRYKH